MAFARAGTILLWAALCGAAPAVAEVTIRQIPGQAELGTVEIHNVGAGAFNLQWWRAGTLYLVPDARSPLIAPRQDGVFRNIYAPSAVETPRGWTLFYGGWDGRPSGNDCIYRLTTGDFLTFRDWAVAIEHGEFVHVCNVNAIRDPAGGIRMVCTAYPVGDGDRLNKPVVFTGSFDGKDADRGRASAIKASHDALASITGYPQFAGADMNGVNVLLAEDGQYRLYFGDFRNFGKVYRASSTDGKHFNYDGPCLDARLMVNDVRKLSTRDGAPCYLMGLHGNRDRLWYALSSNGMQFDAPQELAVSLGPAERYIVAIGWVTRQNRVLGFLYGAGAAPSLDRNRIFARWLQKKVVFEDDAGQTVSATAALGPDRAILRLGPGERTGRLRLLAEDGRTPLCEPMAVKLVPGGVYRIEER